MNDLEKLLNRQPDPTQKFLIREKQIDRQGGINLDQYSIFRVAYKGFDAQVLFDFSEENLDLPAVFVDIGDGFGHKSEMVGQKLITLATFRVTIADAAQA